MKYINTTEASAIIGITRKGVRELIRKGILKAERVGRDWLVDKKSVDKVKKNRPKVGRPRKEKK